MFKCFRNLEGAIVAGNVSSFLDLCSKGGGGVFSSPCTKEYTDVPVYLCATLPHSTTSNITRALQEGSKSDDWLMTGLYTGTSRTPCSASHATALYAATMGAWWFVPLLGSVALAVVC